MKKVVILKLLVLISILLSGCSMMQGLDPELLDHHYRPKRSAYFFSGVPNKKRRSYPEMFEQGILEAALMSPLK